MDKNGKGGFWDSTGSGTHGTSHTKKVNYRAGTTRQVHRMTKELFWTRQVKINVPNLLTSPRHIAWDTTGRLRHGSQNPYNTMYDYRRLLRRFRLIISGLVQFLAELKFFEPIFWHKFVFSCPTT